MTSKLLPLRLPMVVTTAALLAACAATPSLPDPPGTYPGTPGATGGATVPGGTPSPPAASPLATEQRVLEDRFRGTPGVIAAQPPTILQLDVPLANSFGAGSAEVRPALNAVLERVAESLRRQPAGRLLVSTPADVGGNAALGQTRAQKVRDLLIIKGIAATRVSLIETPRLGGAVQLRMTLPAAAAQPLARQLPQRTPVGSAIAQPVSTARPGWTEKKP